METPPTTRPSLLLRIRDAGDRDAWLQFVDVYAPLVYRLARRHGLQDADAADVTQEVLQAVNRAAGRLEYDPQRGSFRAWLFTVARNKVANFRAGRRRHAPTTGEEAERALERVPAPDQEAELWEQEYEQRLFEWAAGRVRGGFHDSTWQAFWLTAVEGRTPAEAAAELGLSVGAVYIARSRVLARLRAEVRTVIGDE